MVQNKSIVTKPQQTKRYLANHKFIVKGLN